MMEVLKMKRLNLPVNAILKDFTKGYMSAYALSEKYHCSREAIYRVLRKNKLSVKITTNCHVCGKQFYLRSSNLILDGYRFCRVMCLKKYKGITCDAEPRHSLNQKLKGMKHRCYSPQSTAYHLYGNKGIDICQEWLNDLSIFVEWANDNGYEKGMDIHRIDNDKGYYPNNCIFMSHQDHIALHMKDYKRKVDRCESRDNIRRLTNIIMVV
jgi:hypothetical protein